MTTPNRPPSCDMLAEDKVQADKPRTFEDCLGESMQIIFDDWCHDTGCVPDAFLLSGRNARMIGSFINSAFVYHVAMRMQEVHGVINEPIPRRSEVAELLRLVDASIIGTPTPAEERLQTYANKIRKEWKL